MRTISAGLTVFLTLSISATWAQGEDDFSDATSLSRYVVFDEGERIKTIQELLEMAGSWQEMLQDDNCELALPLMVEFADSATVTSNIIRQGLKPFYNADSSGRASVTRSGALLGELHAAENFYNMLLTLRNAAWVYEAKCLLLNGRSSEGMTRLYRALELISPDRELPLWEEARTLIWEQVGYSRGQ